MSESRVQEVVESRLQEFNVTEFEIISVTPDEKGLFDVRLELLPIVGRRYGTIAAQANDLALKVISALNTATESDVDCGMSSCNLESLMGTSERPVLPMLAKFGIVA